MTTETFFLFLAATLAVNLTPGPSIFYVSTVSAAQGMEAGLVSVAGLSLGIMAHILAAATGAAALISASEGAFLLLKYAGAAYLIYLGLRLLLAAPRSPESMDTQSKTPPRMLFYRGVLVDLLNPKIGLFFLAFLPQFVDNRNTDAFIPVLMLGTVFMLMGAVVNACVAVLVSHGAGKLKLSSRSWISRWVPGGMLLFLGTHLALPGR